MAIDINLVALIISAAALIGTTLQALQQYAATSDGYRRCAPAVVGPWHKKRRRRFRWRELRFETLYAAPFIGFLEYLSEASIPGFCNDTSLLPSGVEEERGVCDERAGWLSIIECLCVHHSFLKSLSQQKPKSVRGVLVPRVEELSRSWDFMPPDVIRPLGVCQVSSLVRIVRLLGLSWVQFDPVSGIYRAEGNHQTITSSVIQGIGTVLQYTCDSPLHGDETLRDRIRYASPYAEADNLACGILAYKKRCGTPLTLDSHESIVVAAEGFCGYWDVSKEERMQHMLRNNSSVFCTFMYVDIVAMTQPYMGVCTTHPCLLRLSDHTHEGGFGLDYFDAASTHYKALFQRLSDSASRQVQWVHEQMSKLPGISVKDGYDVFCAADDYLKERSFLGASHDGWMDPLLSAYVMAVIQDYGHSKSFEQRLFLEFSSLGKGVCQWILANREEARPPFKTFLSLSEQEQQLMAGEAWLTMLLRGRYWLLLHQLEFSTPVEVKWLGSSLPVYIG